MLAIRIEFAGKIFEKRIPPAPAKLLLGSGPDADVHESGHQGVPARTHRGAPILVHLPIHRAIEASASSSGSRAGSA